MHVYATVAVVNGPGARPRQMIPTGCIYQLSTLLILSSLSEQPKQPRSVLLMPQ